MLAQQRTSSGVLSSRMKKMFKELVRPGDGDECYDQAGCLPSEFLSRKVEDGRKLCSPPGWFLQETLSIAYTLSPG